MKKIRFDFNNLFSNAIGARHGVGLKDLSGIRQDIRKGVLHLEKIISRPKERQRLNLEWAVLPFQNQKTIQEIQSLGRSIAAKYENVLFLGIGGSYLGLKAAQDALLSPYYNDFFQARKGRPRIFFEGNNLDPDTLQVLLKGLEPKKTFVVVISKSGETTETKAAFCVVEPWLKKHLGKNYGRQVMVITDSKSGELRRRAQSEQAKDKLSFRSLPLLKGVGGRFSELNMGLLHLAVCGISLNEVLAGAKAMAARCSRRELMTNPAYLYAALMYLLYRKKGKSIAVLMPFSETLKGTADWYVQLLAESLGKKYARKIILNSSGEERWEPDRSKVIHVGRTPVSSRGTNDLHSIQQNNIEGQNDKTVTFIRVEKFRSDLRLPKGCGILSEKKYSQLLCLAQEATEWALVKESRPNCTIVLPQVTPHYWGALLYFFQIATAFEGELLNVNAFDQPGVEGYKHYMYAKLEKQSLPGLAKQAKFIL